MWENNGSGTEVEAHVLLIFFSELIINHEISESTEKDEKEGRIRTGQLSVETHEDYGRVCHPPVPEKPGLHPPVPEKPGLHSLSSSNLKREAQFCYKRVK